MAIQMADLDVDTRDTVYAPDADAAGNERFTTPAAQAAVANAAKVHRSQAMASGDARTQDLNTASNFTDVGEQGLTNYFDGQGYRTQGGLASRNRTVPRTAAQNKAFASCGCRALGPSPLGGTIYHGPGTHESCSQPQDWRTGDWDDADARSLQKQATLDVRAMSVCEAMGHPHRADQTRSCPLTKNDFQFDCPVKVQQHGREELSSSTCHLSSLLQHYHFSTRAPRDS